MNLSNWYYSQNAISSETLWPENVAIMQIILKNNTNKTLRLDSAVRVVVFVILDANLQSTVINLAARDITQPRQVSPRQIMPLAVVLKGVPNSSITEFPITRMALQIGSGLDFKTVTVDGNKTPVQNMNITAEYTDGTGTQKNNSELTYFPLQAGGVIVATNDMEYIIPEQTAAKNLGLFGTQLMLNITSIT